MTVDHDRLASLVGGENLNFLDDYILLLTESTDETSFKQALLRTNTRFQGDFNQIIGSKFERLYRMNREIRNHVYNDLSEFGIALEVLDEYFMKEAHVCAGLAIRSGDIGTLLGAERAEAFIKRSNQLMLDYLRRYVGADQP